MKRDDIDWKVLRGSLIALVVSLAVSASLLSGSFYFEKKMNTEYVNNNAQFQSISRRYLAIDEEEKLIKKYYPIFIDLYNQGVLGKEHRLNWIEVLKSSGDRIKLPSLNYQVASQNTYTPAFSANLGRYQLYASTMSLSMQLLHEGDLFELFESLDTEANGIYNTSNCRLDRSSSTITDNPNAANVNAKCELTWFTINLADGTKLEI